MSQNKSRKSKAVAPSKRRQQPIKEVKNVTVPFAKTQIITTRGPKRGLKTAMLREQHIMSVVNSLAFSVNNGLTAPGYMRINPSNQVLFPSLANEAANYDSYRFKRLRVYYSQLATVNTTGRIALMWDSDSQDSAPSTRVEVPQYTKAVTTAVYEACSMTIPTDNVWRFVNDSDVVDRKLVDLGQLFVAVHSGSTTTEVGDVFLEYDVEFKDPQPTATLIQTGILDIGGSLTSYGPRFINGADLAVASTTISCQFNLAGTFMVTFIATATSGGSLTVTGNSSVVGTPRGGFAGTTYSVTFAVTCTGVPNTTPSIRVDGMAGLTRLQFTIVRCKTINALIAN